MRPPTELSYSQMAGATCFSLHPSLKWKASRGPYIKDVRKIFGFIDPLPPLSEFLIDLYY